MKQDPNARTTNELRTCYIPKTRQNILTKLLLHITIQQSSYMNIKIFELPVVPMHFREEKKGSTLIHSLAYLGNTSN